MLARLPFLFRDGSRQDHRTPASEDGMAESEAMANSFEHVAEFFMQEAASFADWGESPQRSGLVP